MPIFVAFATKMRAEDAICASGSTCFASNGKIWKKVLQFLTARYRLAGVGGADGANGVPFRGAPFRGAAFRIRTVLFVVGLIVVRQNGILNTVGSEATAASRGFRGIDYRSEAVAFAESAAAAGSAVCARPASAAFPPTRRAHGGAGGALALARAALARRSRLYGRDGAAQRRRRRAPVDGTRGRVGAGTWQRWRDVRACAGGESRRSGGNGARQRTAPVVALTQAAAAMRVASARSRRGGRRLRRRHRRERGEG